MTFATEYLQPADFIAYVEGRGYRAEPLLNTGEIDAFGSELRIVGYTLRGPRGNKTVVGKNADGLLPLFDAQLWCDGVDYATGRARQYRAQRKRAA